MSRVHSFFLTCGLVVQLMGALVSRAQRLDYSTYLSSDPGPIAVDASGQACVITSLLNKLRSDGSVIYSIGPSPNSGSASVVAIDSQGNSEPIFQSADPNYKTNPRRVVFST